ncbi:hypothetical protein F2Q70_00011416 [Brassica cretica]|uniref:Uncharacterized protein n=1 Tax=Brassica cretica TaxID=69181 RepID=A0A3N6T8S7_BRACR|nr:hypothetical protein F2Q68_00004537 [Brassica cretica]KAF2612325.1 hypothetical protein F2Q70_00011416 [Brassica cretica]
MLCFQNVLLINLRHILTMVEQLIRLIVHSRSLLRTPRTLKLLDQSLSSATRPPQRYSTILFFNGFLHGQLGLQADGSGPGQWRAVRSDHEAMGCWELGQGRGLSPERLGNGVGLCPTQNQVGSGDWLQVAERCNPWPIVAHSLQVMHVRGARLTPSFSINMGSSLSI